mmetsp:Transcript_35121/g.56316  ORF Transcript_35121/g.56316 Transcript_35121/m.56316 type:complete len:105 (-) Transcript_35121:158-472(-)
MKAILTCLPAVALLLQGCEQECHREEYNQCVYKDEPNIMQYGDDCQKLRQIAFCLEGKPFCCNHIEGGMTPPNVTMSEMMNNMGAALVAEEVNCEWANPCGSTG